jgi:hypothetical protein
MDITSHIDIDITHDTICQVLRDFDLLLSDQTIRVTNMPQICHFRDKLAQNSIGCKKSKLRKTIEK